MLFDLYLYGHTAFTIRVSARLDYARLAGHAGVKINYVCFNLAFLLGPSKNQT